MSTYTPPTNNNVALDISNATYTPPTNTQVNIDLDPVVVAPTINQSAFFMFFS